MTITHTDARHKPAKARQMRIADGTLFMRIAANV